MDAAESALEQIQTRIFGTQNQGCILQDFWMATMGSLSMLRFATNSVSNMHIVLPPIRLFPIALISYSAVCTSVIER